MRSGFEEAERCRAIGFKDADVTNEPVSPSFEVDVGVGRAPGRDPEIEQRRPIGVDARPKATICMRRIRRHGDQAFFTNSSNRRWIASLPAQISPLLIMSWPPLRSVTNPPASRTMTIPAATSQELMPRSQ